MRDGCDAKLLHASADRSNAKPTLTESRKSRLKELRQKRVGLMPTYSETRLIETPKDAADKTVTSD